MDLLLSVRSEMKEVELDLCHCPPCSLQNGIEDLSREEVYRAVVLSTVRPAPSLETESHAFTCEHCRPNLKTGRVLK